LIDFSIVIQVSVTTTTSVADSAIDMPQQNFLSLKFWTKFQKEVP